MVSKASTGQPGPFPPLPRRQTTITGWLKNLYKVFSPCQTVSNPFANFQQPVAATPTAPLTQQTPKAGLIGFHPQPTNVTKSGCGVSFSFDLQHGPTILFIVEGGDDSQVGRLSSALSIRWSALRQSVLVYRAAA
jgi:hypothetical protein